VIVRFVLGRGRSALFTITGEIRGVIIKILGKGQSAVLVITDIIRRARSTLVTIVDGVWRAA
jgi:hypothetical protein